jgi:hypothetical protein
MSNRAFGVFISAVLASGAVVGFELSKFSRLETYKLLNIAGILYTLLAVIVLTEVAASSSAWKRIAVAWIAPAVLWVHTAFPLGLFFGGLVGGYSLRGGSGVILSKFAIGFFFYSILPLSVLNDTVVFPQFAALRTLESRWRWLGLFLLLTGIVLQLLAAILAL